MYKMDKKNLFEKVWDAHTVKVLSNGQTQLFVGRHLIHEVTSPQAFGMLREKGLAVRYPERTFATVDHIVPTNESAEPYSDPLADAMIKELRKNCEEFGVTFFDVSTGKQGIVHVVGPEQGLTQPGMTIACGDSHTSTHGAFGAIAFGIGTSQVRDLLGHANHGPWQTQGAQNRGKWRARSGSLRKGCHLHIIRKLGVNGGTGYAYEYAGDVFDRFTMEERMTVCNMSIEGGARVGYVNPDDTTFEYIKGRPYAPKDEDWNNSVETWRSFASDDGCEYDDVVRIDAADIPPTVTWGINPGQAIGVDESIPSPDSVNDDDRAGTIEALEYMKLNAGAALEGTPIDVAFLGSCTNGRLSDLEEVAKHINGHKVKAGIKAIVVPGSQIVSQMAVEKGLDKVFIEAGFEWRGAGCSMCLAMNPDKLIGDQLCASSSNRNFKGRQGSPTGRTMLMSPVMVAAAAVTGKVSDARKVFQN